VAGLDQSAFGSLPDEPAACALATPAVIDTSNTVTSFLRIFLISSVALFVFALCFIGQNASNGKLSAALHF
jgi:hypothetical protein